MFTLYRKGFTHIVPSPTVGDQDIQCELIRVTEGQLDEYRKKGWSDDPRKLKTVKEESGG